MQNQIHHNKNHHITHVKKNHHITMIKVQQYNITNKANAELRISPRVYMKILS